MTLFNKNMLEELKEKKGGEKKHTILVVDDEMNILESMVNLLSEDFHVLTANDGLEALELIQQMAHPEEISLIISDQRMPKLTGIELFERLVNIIPNTIRIILTAHIEASVMHDAINRARVNGYIIKHYDPADFLKRIKQFIKTYELNMTLAPFFKLLESKTKEWQKSNEEKDFLIKIVDDLKKPLKSISSSINRLHSNYDELNQTQIKDLINNAYESNAQITDILANLFE